MTVAGAVSEPLTLAGQIAEPIGPDGAAAKIIENFKTVTDSPGGVQRLRGMVLDLAFQGRLVPQDQKDEQASVLLDRIAEANLHLVKSRKLDMKKVRPPTVSREEVAFEIPASWQWTRFGIICDTRLGKMLDKAKNSGTLRPYLRNANLQWFRFDLADVLELRLPDDEVEEHSVRAGDLLICEGGEPGRAAICDDTIAGMVFQKALHRARPFCGIDSKFLAYLLRCDTWAGRLDARFTGATIKHFTGKALREYPVPVPPLPEQKRIVARVDQLMALCDELETGQAKRAAVRARLTRSALESLTTADDPASFPAALHRVMDNFGILVGGPRDVATLRQAIIDIAFQDRFVSANRMTKTLWKMVDLRAVLSEPLANGRSVPDGVGGSPVLRLSAFRSRAINFAFQKASAWPCEDAEPFFVRSGDVFFVRGNGALRLVGRASIAGLPPDPVAFPDTAIRARPNPEMIKTDWLWYLTESRLVRDQIESVARTTAGIFKVSQDDIYALKIPVPPLTEQREIVAILDRLMNRCDQLEASLTLAEVRASGVAAAIVNQFASHGGY